ncbi:putative amidohydrolase [Naematelia encephala]|uniref:Putative amidohydrolase n=1 Tax=Naematelia encephala TaxID=71784 RepID=A0A1Y2B329_9TREE|nr:putative amidohydrolase [Naematelia encephala]
MGSPSTTPGCFGAFFRQQHRTDSRTTSAADLSRMKPTAVPVQSSHGLLEPCICHERVINHPFYPRHQEDLPAYHSIRTTFNADAKKTIVDEIAKHTDELMVIQSYLSDNPEINYQEHKAHDKLTSYLESKGFSVEKHFLLPTAWRATFVHGKGGRTFGFNSEMDALPGIGHACGHNLIAVCGIAAFMGVAKALVAHDIPGKVILLGTPAEEGGAGKVALLDKGGYEGIDACMMNHPGGHQAGAGRIAPTMAMQLIWVEYTGKTSHAASAPWDGINALDAATLAYASISAMRQQIKPTDRIHGIITNGGQAPNIIPEHTQMKFFARAVNVAALDELLKKILPIFDAAAKATGCQVKVWTESMQKDLNNVRPLAEEYAAAMGELFNIPVDLHFELESGGSTDFGNVTYAMPACHPMFGIDHDPARANHTPEFTARARTPGAHKEAMKAAAGMACVGMRFLGDKAFADDTKSSWKKAVEN